MPVEIKPAIPSAPNVTEDTVIRLNKQQEIIVDLRAQIADREKQIADLRKQLAEQLDAARKDLAAARIGKS